MSIHTNNPAHTKNLAAVLSTIFLSARDIEDAQSTTIGSLSDLSPIFPGTIDQYSQDRHIYFSDLDEYSDYESAPTGKSVISDDAQVRMPVTLGYRIIDHEMLQLVKAANDGDEHTYVELAKNVNWNNRSASDLLQGIQLAFQAGAHLHARYLTVIGIEHYPENQDLQKYATVLAPVEVIERNLPPDPTLKDNRDWLKTHKDEYKGRWVALNRGRLIEASRSLKDLKNTINQTDDVLFARVS